MCARACVRTCVCRFSVGPVAYKIKITGLNKVLCNIMGLPCLRHMSLITSAWHSRIWEKLGVQEKQPSPSVCLAPTLCFQKAYFFIRLWVRWFAIQLFDLYFWWWVCFLKVVLSSPTVLNFFLFIPCLFLVLFKILIIYIL